MNNIINYLLTNKKIIFFTILPILGISGIWSGINHYFRLKDDNPFEEKIENVIERETGQRLDLTPDSIEK